MVVRRRRKFTEEQRAEAVRLVYEVGSVSKVAVDLGIDRAVIRRWYNKAEEAKGNGRKVAAESELEAANRRLKKENSILKQERDFLKKAAAFFAKENDRPSN